VAIGVGSETSLFNAVSMVHPAYASIPPSWGILFFFLFQLTSYPICRMLSVDDATKLAMPVAVYISKDEDQEEVMTLSLLPCFGKYTECMNFLK
jgi:hypothetical protein